MSGTIRKFSIIAGIVLVIVLILGGTWLWFTRRAFPDVRGTIEVEGLTATVEIYRDSYGIPHIYAETAEDLVFAQGYVHAQDRYWQMEFWRRIGSGELSELFGPAQLDSDIYLRTVGYRRVAEMEWEQADSEFKALLEAYAAGINAYTQSRPPAELGLEFALLELQGVDVTVEPWEPVNTLTWQKVMSQSLSYSVSSELAHMDLIPTLGLDLAEDLYPPYRYADFPVIVPDEDMPPELLSPVANHTESIRFNQGDSAPFSGVTNLLLDESEMQLISPLGSGSGIGSNNWVISGALTTTGKPLLANDMHLGIQMPSIWYEIGLHCTAINESCPYNLRGFSFPGTPLIIVGHNDYLAWGVTNEGPDVLDLYIERINPENPDQYEVGGEWVDMDIIYEFINVAGQDEPVVIQIRNTRNGPVMSDHVFDDRDTFLIDENGELTLTAISMRWTALQPNRTFTAVMRYTKATTIEEFLDGISYFDGPAQNFVFADTEGNIGYHSTALIPIRNQGDGTVPVPGWVDDFQWTGFIPFYELPQTINPDKGWIATANQNITSENYIYFISDTHDYGHRAERIRQLIEEYAGDISPDTIALMHGDNTNIFAADLVPYLDNLSLNDPELAELQGYIVNWDGRMDMDSTGAAVFGYYLMALSQETFDDQMVESRQFTSASSRSLTALYYLLDQPDNPWWDDVTTPDVKETRDDILITAFEHAYQLGTEQSGTDISKWEWGEIHTALFRNQTLGSSGIGLIEAIFNRGPVAAGGDGPAINSTDGTYTEPFLVESIPSQRQIIDLSDLANSRMVHTTGQSGHPYHKHYDDFIDPWRFIEYHPTNWTQEMVTGDSRQLLQLVPR